MFNPTLMYHFLKIGAIHMQRGANTFVKWASEMMKTLPESEPFLKSIWNSLISIPKNDTLNEKELTAYMQYVGAQYDHGMTDKVDLRRDFIDTLGPSKVKYFESAYQAVINYPFHEAKPNATIDDGIPIELGDFITLYDPEKNEGKTYKMMKKRLGSLTELARICLQKRKGEWITYQDKKYKITKITNS